MSTKHKFAFTLFAFALVGLTFFAGARLTAYAREAEMEGFSISADASAGVAVSSSASDSQMEFFGKIESIGTESWTVNGMVFMISPSTEIKGALQAGDMAKVHAFVGQDGQMIAREIEASQFADSDGNGNGDDNNNMNGDDHGDDDSNLNGADDSNTNGDDNSNGNEDDDVDDDDSNGNDNDSGDDDNSNDSQGLLFLIQRITF